MFRPGPQRTQQPSTSCLSEQDSFLKVSVGLIPWLDGADFPIVLPFTYKRSSKLSEGLYHLTQLHIATYVGYYDDIVTLAQRDSNAVFEINWKSETSRQMLQNTMPVDVTAEWFSRFCNVVEGVCKFLESKELELKKSQSN